MEIMYRYLSLFLLLAFLVLPAGAEQNIVSGYENLTGEPGNVTLNASQNYSHLDSGLISDAAGGVEGYQEKTYTGPGNITFLTDTPESELFPVWTPDGKHILYTVQRNGSRDLESYKMNANGSDVERTGIGEGNLTAFSDINPNGTELIITKSTGSQTGLYLASLVNGTVISVTDDPDKSESWGAWCRLGHKIIYTQKSGDAPSQLWIVDRDGSNKTRLGTSENVGMGKDWCPLGLKLVYSAKNSKQKPDLWTIERDGSNQTQLTDTPYGEWNPSFSPNGKRVAYVSDEGGKPEIWLLDIPGKYKIRLTNNNGVINSNPRWSPDGSKIVFTAHNLQNISNNSTTNNTDLALLSIPNNSIMTDNLGITNNSTAEDNFTKVNNSVIVNNSTENDSIITNNSTENGSIITNNSAENDSIITNNSIVNESKAIYNSIVNDSKTIYNSIVNSSMETNNSTVTNSIAANSSEVNDSIATNNSTVNNFIATNNSTVNGSIATNNSTVNNSTTNDSDSIWSWL